jgi:hypothetical protein
MAISSSSTLPLNFLSILAFLVVAFLLNPLLFHLIKFTSTGVATANRQEKLGKLAVFQTLIWYGHLFQIHTSIRWSRRFRNQVSTTSGSSPFRTIHCHRELLSQVKEALMGYREETLYQNGDKVDIPELYAMIGYIREPRRLELVQYERRQAYGPQLITAPRDHGVTWIFSKNWFQSPTRRARLHTPQ